MWNNEIIFNNEELESEKYIEWLQEQIDLFGYEKAIIKRKDHIDKLMMKLQAELDYLDKNA